LFFFSRFPLLFFPVGVTVASSVTLSELVDELELRELVELLLLDVEGDLKVLHSNVLNFYVQAL